MLDKREKPRRRPRRMNAGLRGLQDKYLTGAPLSRKDVMMRDIMMDNEPRMQDRSPEGQMFSIESEIKNMMKEYEMAVRDGDNQRAQMIADQIDRMQQKIIGLQGGIANKMMGQMRGYAEGDEVTQEIASPVVRIDVDFEKYFTPSGMLDEQAYNQALEEAKTKSKNMQEVLLNYEKAIQVANPEEKQMLIKGLQEFIDTEKKYNNFSEIFTPSLAVKMAEGGEAEMPEMEMSEQEAMAELEAAGPDFEIVEQLIGAVVQMIQQGVSEAEVKEFLREQGLDEEDIQELFEAVMERLQQAPAEEPIGQELQGMM